MGQVCDKKTSIYFEKNAFDLAAQENQKLEKLTKLFAQKNDTFFLEIHAFSDSVASAEYNYNLAGKRLKSVLQYIKKNAACHFKIVEKVRGEVVSSRSNTTEAGLAENRRVDVFYWKMKDGKITLKGKGLMELDIEPEYFGSCGVCESNPKMTTVYTNEDAARQGIPMTTTDGEQLITGGMMTFDFSCQDKESRFRNRKRPCPEIVIRIPSGSFDNGYEIWRATPERERSALRWYTDPDGVLEYDEKNKCYLLRVNFCPGQPFINLDKLVTRQTGGNIERPYVPDSIGAIAIPELSRSRTGTYVQSEGPGYIIGYGKAKGNLWQFRYRGKSPVFFTDSGMAKNKIGYMFSGPIARYEAECDTLRCRSEKQCWCFEVPIDAYTKIIYFKKNKEHRLKLPFKYRKYSPKLFIPAADTVLAMTKVSRRKYSFQQPLPDTYVVVYNKKADASNKRAYDAHVSLDDIKTKHHRRPNYYKAKLKRRQLQKAIQSNS